MRLEAFPFFSPVRMFGRLRRFCSFKALHPDAAIPHLLHDLLSPLPFGIRLLLADLSFVRGVPLFVGP